MSKPSNPRREADNEAKVVLATEATAMLHGREAAEAAARTAADTFGGGGMGEDLPTLSLGEGMTMVHALTALGFTPSNKEAKRKIAEGAVRLGDEPVNDPGLVITAADEPLALLGADDRDVRGHGRVADLAPRRGIAPAGAATAALHLWLRR